MFEYIRGKLTLATVDKAVVDVGGIGYLLFIPFNTLARLPSLKEEVFFYLTSVIREDSYRNFGFLTSEERDLFEKVSNVSGIGPKTALALIGHLERGTLETAIRVGDHLLLSKIPGIGKKTAERLIVDMRDKIEKQAQKGSKTSSGAPLSREIDTTIHDAINALLHLGYKAPRAQFAVKKALEQFDGQVDLSALITAALRET